MVLQLDDEDFQLLEVAQPGTFVDVRIGAPEARRVSRLRLGGLIETGPVRDGTQRVVTSMTGRAALERRVWEHQGATLDPFSSVQPGTLSELRDLLRSVCPRVQVNRTQTPFLLEVLTPSPFAAQERNRLLQWLDDNLPLSFTYRLSSNAPGL
ncbi:hypothetical protein GCM10007301_28540 [Azorhizobium oxalatiphilum]|uniref:Uncharacterized protein n=1 Tax=Azorhizobium oxalatiphilum TaxID=980631 RepID=A0A917C1B3_9HYPH|nr:hypothetical protein [Azorhizobium oxalatiphilum]GGF67169.1 hypothetical protein GCM10007301_28540 [Azorhizobium oxalatiphilum]